MKKIILMLFSLSIISLSGLECDIDNFKYDGYTEGLSYLKIKNSKIYKAYILVDDNTDEILIADKINSVLPLASLTKIMTAMVVLDNIKDLNKKIIIKHKVAKIPYGTRLKAGRAYSVNTLMHFMLMESSNSSAQALADYVSPNFVSLMNKKAEEIGAKSLRYCTPHGLRPAYTRKCMDMGSAYDIYKISKYAIDNYPEINYISSTSQTIIDGQYLNNTNKLLEMNQNVRGLKTGFHDKSKYNISILYDNDFNRLYEVILGSDTEEDRLKISETVFSQFE